MATLYPGKLLLLMAIIGGCLCLLASFSIAEMNIKSSSSGVSKKKHEHFMPLVAFQCGFRNKYMNADGRWQDDPSSAAGCLHGKYDILKYCKRVYPNEQITNIVEYSHLTRIDHWCREDGTDCHHHQFTMRPFRCISGEFITESLQVPQRCHFSHIAGKDKCNDYKFWNVRAEEECGQKKEEGTNQPMRLRSFAILEPCGLGMFRGVEFVCCPKELEERIEKVVDLEAEDGKKTPTTPSDDDEDEDDDDDEDEYSEEDEDEEEGKSSSSKKETAKEEGTGAEQQDKYFKDDPSANEHERFREAEERLEKKHRKKVTKVITEWSELFERYNKMKEKDPKGAEQYKREMTAKFRKTVASLEAENHEQRKQIEELHDERVQTALNEKKRQATHEYRAALAVQVGQTNKQNVLRTLKNYIRAEEKDRQHMLNRYRHLLRSDPEAAVSFEPILLHRLRYIDLRINGTLAMLRDFPELEKEIRPVAIGFWKAYRKENTPEALDEEAEGSKKTISTGGHYLSDEERNAQLIRLYKQNFERKHPAAHLAMQLQESAKQQHGSETTKTTTTTATRKMVALKDVLKEDASSVEASKKLQKMAQSSSSEKELEEDSDEDQFEEDEDGEKTTLMSMPSSTKTPVKIHVELLNGAEGAATKTMKKGNKKGDDEKPAKLMTSKATSSESEEEDDDEEEDEDEDEDMSGTGGGSEAESEYSASNDKKAPAEGAKRKHMRIDVEPIMLAPSPDELNGGDGPIAYAKHHRSFTAHKTQDDYSSNMDSSIIGRWLAQANLLLGLIALTFAALAIIILLRRRRNRHPGFIEVDVCTPEESHVQGMQVNGYENPTYTFFEGKQQC